MDMLGPAWQAPAQVLTDPVLWRCITSFQRGIPLPLYELWVAHEPSIAHSTDRNLVSDNIDGLIKRVVQHGTLELLKLLPAVRYHRFQTNEWTSPTLQPVAELAIRVNRADMLEWVIVNAVIVESNLGLWRLAMRHFEDGDVRVLEVLKLYKPIDDRELRRLTATITEPALVDWVESNFPGVLDKEIMEHAVRDFNIQLVQHLLDNFPKMEFGSKPYHVAHKMNQQEILRCLLEKRPGCVDPKFVGRLIVEGTPWILELLKNSGAFEAPARKVASRHITSGMLDELRQLVEFGWFVSGKPFSINRAAASGFLEVIQFLDERGLAIATTEAMDAAAEAKKWDVVMYLHENRSDGCTTRVMDAAAEDELERVKFFHDNRSEGCTTRAMDIAAKEGRLHVVKYLHENRSEGCSTDAMDLAAAWGELIVVQYLHANRTEGCTVKAVKKALKNGYLTTVRFLYEHYRSLFGPELLQDLLLRGAFDIWMELREIYPEEANAVVEPALLSAGQAMELATIDFIIHKLGRDDLVHVAVDGAAKNTSSGQAQWQRAVMAITGPRSCRLSAVRNAVRAARDYSEPDELKFLISVCSESGAKEVAIEEARASDKLYSLPGKLEAWAERGCMLELSKLHPLLLHTRCPSWAVRLALADFNPVVDHYNRCWNPVPWAVQAIYRDDRVLLEILRDLRLDGVEYSFDGARAAAIRKGNLPMLEWLLNEVELPAEPTLLDEALFYHQFEIAQWLVDNHRQGCLELNWESKHDVPWMCNCGLVDGIVLDWIERHPKVRELVDFGAVAFRAVQCGDLKSLETIFSTHPEAIVTRKDLAKPAVEHQSIADFLVKIQYPF